MSTELRAREPIMINKKLPVNMIQQWPPSGIVPVMAFLLLPLVIGNI